MSSVPTTWPSTVASAAPATSIRGKGPTPKIISGSSRMLPTRPTAVERRTTTLLPMAVNRPVKIWLKKEKRKPSATITR